MAFPVVAATNASAESGTTTSHTIALPTGITAGDLLLVVFGFGGGGVTLSMTGWTQLFLANSRWSVWARIADGSEGATVTLTTSAGRSSAHNSYRITGQFVSGTIADVVVAGENAGINPPNLAPSWAPDDILWLAGAGTRRTDGSFTAAPANYTDLIQIPSGASSSSDATVRTASSRRNLNAASEDPGAFTYSGTLNAERSWTAAIRPAEAIPEVTGVLTFEELAVAGEIEAVPEITADLDFPELTVSGLVNAVTESVAATLDFEELQVAGLIQVTGATVTGDLDFPELTVAAVVSAQAETVAASLTFDALTVEGLVQATLATVNADVGFPALTGQGLINAISALISGQLTFEDLTTAGLINVIGPELVNGSLTFPALTLAGVISEAIPGRLLPIICEVLVPTVECRISAPHIDDAILSPTVTDEVIR